MSDHTAPFDRAASRLGVDARRVSAFRAANRHSARVRLLRRAIILGTILAVVGILVITIFDPFGGTTGPVTIDGATIEGTKVTMTNPKLAGYRRDGRPYEIQATRAVQDVKAPTLFELHDLKARLVMEDRSVTRLTATIGNYNSVAETMHLSQGAHVLGDTGLDAVTEDAMIDFKANTLSTQRPVSVTMPGKHVVADSMTIIDGGKQVTFDGHVHTDIQPQERTASADPAPPGSSP